MSAVQDSGIDTETWKPVHLFLDCDCLALLTGRVSAVQGTDNDTLEIEIWQSWLLPSNEAEFKHQQENR